MRARRGDRQDLTRLEPLHDIAGRPYQLQALKSVAAAYQAGRRRVLFLADRTELVRQAQHSFLSFFAGEIPLASLLDDGSKQNLANLLTSRVIFSTYPSMMNAIDRAVREDGSRIFTPASFDLIIIDESHRSIYQRYQAIFSYFDSYLLGLTATPKDEVDREHYEEVFGVTDEDAEDIDAAEFNRYIFNRETVVRVLTDLMENGLYVEGGEGEILHIRLRW